LVVNTYTVSGSKRQQTGGDVFTLARRVSSASYTALDTERPLMIVSISAHA